MASETQQTLPGTRASSAEIREHLAELSGRVARARDEYERLLRYEGRMRVALELAERQEGGDRGE